MKVKTTASNNKQKKEALKSSYNEYQRLLEEDVNYSVNELKRVSGISLMVGGVVLAGYMLVRALRSDEKDDASEGETNSAKIAPRSSVFMNSLLAAGVSIASEYALGFAKKKLVAYIESLNNMKNQADEPTEGT